MVKGINSMCQDTQDIPSDGLIHDLCNPECEWRKDTWIFICPYASLIVAQLVVVAILAEHREELDDIRVLVYIAWWHQHCCNEQRREFDCVRVKFTHITVEFVRRTVKAQDDYVIFHTLQTNISALLCGNTHAFCLFLTTRRLSHHSEGI